jgi:hypothetical protein
LPSNRKKGVIFCIWNHDRAVDRSKAPSRRVVSRRSTFRWFLERSTALSLTERSTPARRNLYRAAVADAVFASMETFGADK